GLPAKVRLVTAARCTSGCPASSRMISPPAYPAPWRRATLGVWSIGIVRVSRCWYRSGRVGAKVGGGVIASERFPSSLQPLPSSLPCFHGKDTLQSGEAGEAAGVASAPQRVFFAVGGNAGVEQRKRAIRAQHLHMSFEQPHGDGSAHDFLRRVE